MKNKLTLSLVTAGVLCALTALAFSSPPVPPATLAAADEGSFLPAELRRLQATKDDISLLNLINGLNLSREQLERLVALAAAARRTVREAVTENASLLTEATQAFEQLRAALESGAVPTPRVERIAGQVDHELGEAKERPEAELARIGRELRAVFTAEQVQVVLEFTPCVIPPKSLRDPVRVGQAHGTDDQVAELLVRARAAAGDEFEAEAPTRIAAHLRKAAHKLGQVGPEELRAEADRLVGILREVRQLPEAEFQVRLAEWVERVRAAGTLVARLGAADQRERAERALHLDRRLADWFLTPRAERLLQRRLATLAAAPTPAATDLDAIRPAESCTQCGQKEAGR